MPNQYTQIYHSPIGVIKIIADDFCIEELIFIEEEIIDKIEISPTTPAVSYTHLTLPTKRIV